MSGERHVPALRGLQLRLPLPAAVLCDPATGPRGAQGARLLPLRRRHRLLQLGVAQVNPQVLEQVLQTVSGAIES